MSDYNRIIPCGLVGKGVTSLCKLKPELLAQGTADSVLQDVKQVYLQHFQTVFGVELVSAPLPDLSVFEDGDE